MYTKWNIYNVLRTYEVDYQAWMLLEWICSENPIERITEHVNSRISYLQYKITLALWKTDYDYTVFLRLRIHIALFMKRAEGKNTKPIRPLATACSQRNIPYLMGAEKSLMGHHQVLLSAVSWVSSGATAPWIDACIAAFYNNSIIPTIITALLHV